MDDKKPHTEESVPSPVPISPAASQINETKGLGGIPVAVKFLHEIVIALVVVLFVGFAGMFVAVATMFVTAWNEDRSAQQDLRDKIIEQNTKIDLLYLQHANGQKNISITLPQSTQ